MFIKVRVKPGAKYTSGIWNQEKYLEHANNRTVFDVIEEPGIELGRPHYRIKGPDDASCVGCYIWKEEVMLLSAKKTIVIVRDNG